MSKPKSTAPKDRQSLVGIFLFLPIPIAITAVGCYFYVAAIDAGIDSEETVGVVVGFDVTRDRDGESKKPVVKYTVGGKTYHCHSGAWGTPYSVGDHLPIRYKRNDPEQAVVDTIMDRWWGPLCALCGGLFFAIPMTAYIIQRLRKNRGS